jgi:hypothetical protein
MSASLPAGEIRLQCGPAWVVSAVSAVLSFRDNAVPSCWDSTLPGFADGIRHDRSACSKGLLTRDRGIASSLMLNLRI